jgi:hypothetical protein
MESVESLTASYINRWFGQEGKCLVPKKGLRCSNHISWEEIRHMLVEWEKKGRIRILRDPATAAMDDICIELLTIPGTDRAFPSNWIGDRPSS